MRRSFEGKRHQPAKSEEKRKRCDRKHRGFGFFCAFLLCAGLISGGAAVSGESGAQEAVNAEAPADDAVQPEVPAQPVEEAQQNTPAPEDTEGGGEAGQQQEETPDQQQEETPDQQQEETPDQQQEELYPEDDGNGEESVPSVSRPDAGSAESSAAPVGTTAEPLTVSVTTAMKYAFAGENALTFETQITGGTEPFETSYEIDRDGTPVWSAREYQPELTYMPEEAGGYELVLSVTDAAGQAASGRCAIPVAVRHEESPSDWEPALKEVRMTGRYAEDLLAIARTQLGYTESADNFIVTEEGARQGYTRYGQWQGDAYEPWDAAFAAFCLYYAGVRDVPADTKAEKWADELKRRGMYRDLTAENRPEEGDFLFTRDGEVTRIGLVEKTDDTGVTAIEGDVGGAVARVTYGWDDARLAGFGDPRTTLTDEAAGVTVTGIFPEGATLTVQLLAEDADGLTEAQDRIHAALSPLYDRYAVNLADVTETAVYVPSLTVNGEVVSPCKKVRVGVSACGGRFAGHGDVRVLTFSDEQTELLSAEEKDGGDGADAIVSASFRTDRLSEFALTAVAPDRLTMRRTAADGDAKVTVTYGTGAGVPESAELRVRQIRGDGDDADRAEYQKRQAEAAALLETEAGGENAASQPDTAASGSPGNAENADVSRQTDQNAENAAADQQADQNAENAAADQTEDSKEYAAYMEEVEAALASGRKVQMAKLFDITILDKEGNEVEPLTPVCANIEFVPKEVQEGTDLELYQFQTEGEKPQVMENVEVLTDDDNIVNGIEFETDGFSVYGIVGTETLTTNYITAEGDTYTITVTYGKDAEIPEGATLEVSELANDSKEYTDYVEQAAKALAEGEEVPFVNAARLFDISIMADGKKVEPKAPVEVKIEYANAENLNETSEVGAVHFKESTFKTETEVMDVNVQGEEGKVDGVTFTTDSFSIYAVIIIDKEAGTFVVEDENYKVTITYTKEANIPIGTEMTVEQVDPESDHYLELKKETISKINEGVFWGDHDMSSDPRKGITDAVFFDISLRYNGTEIEPDVPLTVKIEYKNNGILVPNNEETNIIHFSKTGTEIIDDVNVELSASEIPELNVATSYEYQQESFSEVGSYSTGVYIENLSVSSGVRALAAPSLRATSEIAASKDISDEDGDGVYELSLSVTGQAQSDSSTSVNKSNVVLVIDTSGSMNTVVSYTPYTYSASTYNSDTTYYGYRNNEYIQVWRSGNNWYRTRNVNMWGQVSYSNQYNGTVYTGTTRLDATKAAAVTLVDALLGNNKNETQDGVSLSDIVEISLVTFAGNSNTDYYGYLRTYNNTHYSGTKDGSSATSLKNTINGLTAVGGTNWEAALQAAKNSADTYSSQTGESTSVIFLTDGMPTFYGNDNGTGHEIDGNGTWQNPYNRDNVHTSWTNARDDARTIVTSGYTLYNIFAFGTDTALDYDSAGNNQTDADYLRALTNYAYTGSGTYTNKTLTATTRDYFYNASNTTELQNAFQAIINKINNTVGYGGVEVDDGVTVGVTNTSVTVDGSINTNSFHYAIKSGSTTLVTVSINGNTATFKSGTTEDTATATGVSTTVNINGTDHTNTVFTAEVDGTTYKIAPAKMDSNGKITWELAPVGIIENGYTYELTFDVWPNQLAYDMVADLNNGVKTLDEIKADVIAGQGQAVWDQIEAALVSLGNGKYAVRTNYEQYVDYYTVDTTQEEGQDPVTTYTQQPRKELGPKDPVALTSSSMELRKIWDDSLDDDQLNELLWGEDFKTNPVATKYGVKLHIWKADTLEELQTLLTNYSEPDSSGSYAAADSHDYMDTTLGWDEETSEYIWHDNLEVAPGTMIDINNAEEMGIDVSKHTQVVFGSKTYVVLESGHYYTVSEENVDRHFELNTIVYHPMLVDGTLSNVTFKADGTVENIVPMSTVDATNTLKGGINILKRAFDGETEIVATDDIFTVQVTVNNVDGTPYRDWDYRIYYGDNNPLKTDTVYRSDHYFGTQAAMDASGSSGQVDPINGGSNVITLDLYIGDTVRIINVPAGVTYSVVETKVNGEELNGGAAGNYVFHEIKYEISEGSADSFVEDTTSPHTVKGNSSSQATVYNRIPTQKIGVKKIGDGSITNTLEGVSFKLYKDSNANNTYDKDEDVQIVKDALGHAIGTNGVLTTGENGTVEIGTLLAGKYFLVETDLGENTGYNKLTAAVTITVNSDSEVSYDRAVSYVQDDYSACNDSNHAYETGKGLLIQDMTDEYDLTYYYYTVTVNNSTGVTLPNTGGSGTLPYTLGGIALIMASALMYGFRMRRRERRLN